MFRLQHFSVAALTTLTALVAVACKDRSRSSDYDMRTQQEDNVAELRGASLKNSEAAAVVRVANQGEIEEAQAALPRLQSEAAKNLARTMLREHTDSQNELERVINSSSIQPQESVKTSDLKVASAANVRSLKSADDEDVDRVYVDAQIKEHEDLLKLLDQGLIDDTQDAKLVQFLRDLRGTVASHVEHAKRVKQELESAK